MWDDTARWYPPLLAAGVRVVRAHDLRLGHHVLRRAPAVDHALLRGEESELWDRLGPRTPADPGLFAVDDPAEHLRADLEDARQLAAVAASPESARLALLLAAESAGALAAAEMTYAGLPWRADLHEELLSDRLGPRPPRGARPAKLEALAGEVRAALDAPGLNLDSRPELLSALRRVGLSVTDTRAPRSAVSTTPPSSRCCGTSSWRTCSRPTAGSGSTSGCATAGSGPTYLPAGSTTGRWSSNGGGALSLPVQVRPAAVADDGWVLVVADVAQLEPRVLAGMSGDRALAAAARGADLYQGMVDAGAVASRSDAKLGLLGAMYGATTGESGRMVAGLMKRYPLAFGLVEEAARAGERGQVVRTLLGRGSPTIGDAWDRDRDDPPADADSLARQDRQRRAYGRFTRNFVVQGTGAEWALCWIADLRNRLWRLGDGGPRRPAAPGLLPPRRGRRAHPGSARRRRRRRGHRGRRDRRPAGLPRRRGRLPAQRRGRALLRRRGQARRLGRRGRWPRSGPLSLDFTRPRASGKVDVASHQAPLAQLAEQLTLNQRVRGSSP